MAIYDSKLPEAALTPAQPSSRSRLDVAVKSMNDWSDEDKRLFVATYATRKSGQQIAHEFGLSQSSFQKRQRDILRRFMRAAEVVPAT